MNQLALMAALNASVMSNYDCDMTFPGIIAVLSVVIVSSVIGVILARKFY